MVELRKRECPHPDCMSSDAFGYDTERRIGGCFSCGNGYPKKGVVYEQHYLDMYPLGRSRRTEMEPQYKPRVVPLLNLQYRESRGITVETMKFYGVQTEVSSEGKSVSHHYKYPSGATKIRTLPKTFRAEGLRSDELFGMDKFNAGSSKAVTITEGELDAMSAYQMLGSKYPVVSLPTATPSKKIFENCKEWLSSFEKIYLSLDSDGKADGIATKLVNLFPNKIYRVPHDKYKDANEFLQAGASQEYVKSWWSSQKYVPENVNNTTQDFLTLYRESEDPIYLPTGVSELDSVILGLMQGHFTVFQAPEGIGKTEFMRFLEYNILSNHKDIPIAICHMEEAPKRSLLGLVSYQLQQNLTRKELIVEAGMDRDVVDAIKNLTHNENLYQFTLGVDEDPLSILDKIRWFAEACECKFVFFEPIQDLAYSRQTDSTVEQFLSELSTKLARLASELNIGIITIAHENDDGQIRDCRMIGKRASVVVKLERDKMAEDPSVRNLTTLSVTKNRPAGNTGYAGSLVFNPDSFTLNEL